MIPSHNRPDALAGALQSLANQTTPADQIVVVDDGSEPPVDAPRVTVLRNETAGGANAARNRGWQHLNTDWVAFLDDDDRFQPGKIAAVKAAIRPELDVIYHPAWIRMVNEGIGYRTAPKDLSRVEDPYRELLVGNYLGGTPMVTVRRSKLQEVGGFDATLPSMQDYDLWIRLAAAEARFGFIDEPLTHCRYTTEGGGISTNVDKHFAAAAAIQAKHAADYALLSPAQRRDHEVFILNVATHRALMAGDKQRARQLQWEVLKLSRNPRTMANAAVTMLGPKAAFTLRSKLQRGPTAARDGQATA